MLISHTLRWRVTAVALVATVSLTAAFITRADAAPSEPVGPQINGGYVVMWGNGNGHVKPRPRFERAKLAQLRRCLEHVVPGSTTPIRRRAVTESFDGDARVVRRYVFGAEIPTPSGETGQTVAIPTPSGEMGATGKVSAALPDTRYRWDQCVADAMDPRMTAPVNPDSPESDVSPTPRWILGVFDSADVPGLRL